MSGAQPQPTDSLFEVAPVQNGFEAGQGEPMDKFFGQIGSVSPRAGDEKPDQDRQYKACRLPRYSLPRRHLGSS